MKKNKKLEFKIGEKVWFLSRFFRTKKVTISQIGPDPAFPHYWTKKGEYLEPEFCFSLDDTPALKKKLTTITLKEINAHNKKIFLLRTRYKRNMAKIK